MYHETADGVCLSELSVVHSATVSMYALDRRVFNTKRYALVVGSRAAVVFVVEEEGKGGGEGEKREDVSE